MGASQQSVAPEPQARSSHTALLGNLTGISKSACLKPRGLCTCWKCVFPQSSESVPSWLPVFALRLLLLCFCSWLSSSATTLNSHRSALPTQRDVLEGEDGRASCRIQAGVQPCCVSPSGQADGFPVPPGSLVPYGQTAARLLPNCQSDQATLPTRPADLLSQEAAVLPILPAHLSPFTFHLSSRAGLSEQLLQPPVLQFPAHSSCRFLSLCVSGMLNTFLPQGLGTCGFPMPGILLMGI